MNCYGRYLYAIGCDDSHEDWGAAEDVEAEAEYHAADPGVGVGGVTVVGKEDREGRDRVV